jgi:uncharacterized protein (UPF0261 family)
VRRTVGGAEISPEDVAAAAGTTLEEIRPIGHEGKIQETMIAGAIKLALDLHARVKLSGILSIGGSMGTTMGTAVMPAFPYGVPKMMISTRISMTRPSPTPWWKRCGTARSKWPGSAVRRYRFR